MESLSLSGLANNSQSGSTLVPLTSAKTKGNDYSSHQASITQSTNSSTKAKQSQNLPIPTSPDEIVPFLRSEPDTELLTKILNQLSQPKPFVDDEFDLAGTGPVQAQTINILVNNIIPTYWWVIKDTLQRNVLLSCLRNIAGLGAIFARLETLSSKAVLSGSQAQTNHQLIQDLLDITVEMLDDHNILFDLWHRLQQCALNDMKKQLCWKSLVALIASGKVIAITVQAENCIKAQVDAVHKRTWISDGREYSKWIGASIAYMITKSTTATDATALMLSKALGIGYQSLLVGALISQITNGEQEDAIAHVHLGAFTKILSTHYKKQFLEHMCRWLSSIRNLHSSPEDVLVVERRSHDVAGFAAILKACYGDEQNSQFLREFVVDPALLASLSVVVRRAMIAAIADYDDGDLHVILEQIMRTFGDHLFINHAPVLQQEAVAQTLLLIAGHLHKKNAVAVLMAARSSHHMRGISNRLDTSNSRARWLGLAVGTALSDLVDKQGSKMSFGLEDMQTDEAKWYFELVRTEDLVGTLSDFRASLKGLEYKKAVTRNPVIQTERLPTLRREINGKPVFGPERPPEIIGNRITEVTDDDTNEDHDGLIPYAKPDSDAEDSEEDATLVNRDKAKAPVYIRDLMSMLRDDKSAERFQLGIKYAARLIRRKAAFGAEVRDHVEELGSILCNLQDPFSTEDFNELKLQALIAVLLSDVHTMAPWLSRQTFIGDHSIAQRCTMLSALGLGGRELAGFKDEDHFNPGIPDTQFPSKTLPPRLHAIYGGDTTAADIDTKRLESATASTEHSILQPIANDAAQRTSSHIKAVATRTFSSRPAVERTKRKPAANQLAKILSKSFFFPLVNSYQQDLAAYSSSSIFSSVPFLLVTFLKTLAILIHAAGPATLELPLITAEMWELLLSLRTRAVQDISILQAVLFALLTLLEVNTDLHWVATEHPRYLLLTQQWAEMVFERISTAAGGAPVVGVGNGSGGEDENKVRSLAAGVLIKTREIIEKYQRELVGFAFD